jgi:hypothetical protein
MIKIIFVIIFILIFLAVLGYALIVVESMKNCDTCPSVKCDDINRITSQARGALDTVFPNKWFLVEGTLISALRWGRQCHLFKSGKKNFVDGDMDVYVIIKPEDRNQVMHQIHKILSKDGWSYPTDRGDGIYVVHSPLKLPGMSCVKNRNILRRNFDLEIHIMSPVAGGFDVGKMKHLWKSFLVDGIVPSDIIYPLQPCKWGNGIAYAPAKYLEILSKWNGNEYGSAKDMWKPLESILATADWFKCPCELSDGDIEEIKDVSQKLKQANLACFNINESIALNS